VEQKRIFLVCVVATLLACCVLVAGCSSSTSNNTISPSQASANVSQTSNATATPQSPITVAQGGDFSITLRANPSTGYHWEPEFDHEALLLTSSVFVSNPNPHNLVGVPGSQIFTFHAVAKGPTTVTFDNLNPVQKVVGQVTYAITVT
jgi:predicted secreted protein